MITGTFSKALGNIGGYVVAKPEIINYLKYQSKQHLFSTTATPAILGITRAIELIDQEPQWRAKLWENINYLKNGLTGLGLDIGTTASAVIPVKIGDIPKTLETGRLLLKAEIYTNPIMYPAVSKKNARIRMNVMATHTPEHLDEVLNAFADIDSKLHICKRHENHHRGLPDCHRKSITGSSAQRGAADRTTPNFDYNL